MLLITKDGVEYDNMYFYEDSEGNLRYKGDETNGDFIEFPKGIK